MNPFLPTYENRLALHLAQHGVEMTTDEYMFRHLRYIRKLAGLGLDKETMDRLIAEADTNPLVVLEDDGRTGPAHRGAGGAG